MMVVENGPGETSSNKTRRSDISLSSFSQCKDIYTSNPTIPVRQPSKIEKTPPRSMMQTNRQVMAESNLNKRSLSSMSDNSPQRLNYTPCKSGFKYTEHPLGLGEQTQNKMVRLQQIRNDEIK